MHLDSLSSYPDPTSFLSSEWPLTDTLQYFKDDELLRTIKPVHSLLQQQSFEALPRKVRKILCRDYAPRQCQFCEDTFLSEKTDVIPTCKHCQLAASFLAQVPRPDEPKSVSFDHNHYENFVDPKSFHDVIPEGLSDVSVCLYNFCLVYTSASPRDS